MILNCDLNLSERIIEHIPSPTRKRTPCGPESGATAPQRRNRSDSKSLAGQNFEPLRIVCRSVSLGSYIGGLTVTSE